MVYEANVWKNHPHGGTPISAERLNHMEEGIALASSETATLEKRSFASPLAAFHSALSMAWNRPCRIVWLGDSFTYGVGASNPSLDFVNQVTRRLQTQYPSIIAGWTKPVEDVGTGYPNLDMKPGVHSYRSSAGGANSESYFNEVNAPFVIWSLPDLIVHAVGTNDQILVEPYSVPVGEYELNVAEAVDYFTENSIKPVSQVLVHQYLRTDVSDEHNLKYLRALERIASTRPNVMVINMRDEFDHLDMLSGDPLKIFSDGLHPSDRGHALIAETLLKKMVLAAPLAPPNKMLALDTFTSPDETNAVGRPLEVGPRQSTWAATGTAAGKTSGGKLILTAAGSILTAAQIANGEFDGMITIPAPASAGMPGLIVRATNTDSMGLYLNPTASQVQLYRTIGANVVAVKTANKVLPAGDYVLQLRLNGDRVWGYVNGELLIDYTLTASEMTALQYNSKIGYWNSVASPDVKFDYIRASYL